MRKSQTFVRCTLKQTYKLVVLNLHVMMMGGEFGCSDRLSIFNHPERAFECSSTRMLDDRELCSAEIYIFLNCAELECYVEQFDSEIIQRNPHLTDYEVEKEREKSLALWLRKRVSV
ncbi:hypothetical protein Taro_001716, partial [Colocasia esculenta]|nr:hypothetical protein [Colocasia esculenta]